MGEVFLGEHRNIDRKAAIKLLLQEYSANEEIVGRFFQEARAASRIKHPGIVEILDCDMHPTGRAYIVMEFLEGESLRECLARVGRMDQGSALDVVHQIALALEAAHGKGIVHRDLKPDNVFLVSTTATPGPPLVKILDFGIAKLASEGDGGHQRTKTGNILGTPLYMSPEQCRGAGKVDLKADVYSLGCITYELLSGQPPFVRDGAGELLVAHLMEEPKDLAASVPDLLPGLSALVMSMLAKDPARRPASMAEIAAKLESIAGIAPAPAHPVHATGRQSFPGLAPPSQPGLRPSSQPGLRPSPSPATDTTLGRTAGEVVEADELPRSGRRGWLIGGGVAVAAAIAVFALRGSGKHDAAPEGSAPPAPAAAAAPATVGTDTPAAEKPSVPAPKADVRLEVDSTPPGAELWVEGETTARGRTPLTVALPASAPAARATLKSPGFADRALSLDPRGETKLMLRLDKAEKTDKAEKAEKTEKSRPHRASSKGASSAGAAYRPMGD
jgi:serine/threonine-protein kinase